MEIIKLLITYFFLYILTVIINNLMEYLLKIQNTPAIIWKIHNNSLNFKNINKKAIELLYNNTLNINITSLENIPINNIHKVKKILNEIITNDNQNDKVYKVNNVLINNPLIYLKILKIGGDIIMIFESNNNNDDIFIKFINSNIIGVGFFKNNKLVFSNDYFGGIWKSIIKNKEYKNEIKNCIKFQSQKIININNDIICDKFIFSSYKFNYNYECYYILLIIKYSQFKSIKSSQSFYKQNLYGLKSSLSRQQSSSSQQSQQSSSSLQSQQSSSSQQSLQTTQLNSDNNINEIINNKINIQLTSIYGIIDLFMDEKNNNNQKEYLFSIKESCDNINNIINNYNNLININNGNIDIDNNPFDIRKMLSNCIDYFQENITYKIDYDIIPFFIGDHTKIAYVFRSIIDFIIKFRNDTKNSIFFRIHQINNLLLFKFSNIKLIYNDYSKKILNLLSNDIGNNINIESNIDYDLIICNQYCKLLGGNISYTINDIIEYETENSSSDDHSAIFELNFSLELKTYNYNYDYMLEHYNYLFSGKKVLIFLNNTDTQLISNILKEFNINSIICEKESLISKFLTKHTFNLCIINLDLYHIYKNDKLDILNMKTPIIGILYNNNQKVINKIIKFRDNINQSFDFIYNPITKNKLFNILVDMFSNQKQLNEKLSNTDSSDNPAILSNKDDKNDEEKSSGINMLVGIETPDTKYDYSYLKIFIVGKTTIHQKLIVKLAQQYGCGLTVAFKPNDNIAFINKFNVVFVDINNINNAIMSMINIINESNNDNKKIYTIGLNIDNSLSLKNKKKLYKLGIDTIIVDEITNKKISAIFQLLSNKFNH